MTKEKINIKKNNIKQSKVYENITESKEPLAKEEKYKDIKNKKQFL